MAIEIDVDESKQRRSDSEMWADTVKGLRRYDFTETDEELIVLWSRFCNIQAATCLEVDGKSGETVERFRRWCETGDDHDAWS